MASLELRVEKTCLTKDPDFKDGMSSAKGPDGYDRGIFGLAALRA